MNTRLLNIVYILYRSSHHIFPRTYWALQKCKNTNVFLKSLIRFGSRYVFSSSLFSTTVTLITLIAYNASVVFSKVTTRKWMDNEPPFIWYAQNFMGFLDVLEICRTTQLTLWGVESVWDSDLTGTRCEIFLKVFVSTSTGSRTPGRCSARRHQTSISR